jgi:hypothetical protein
MIEAVDRLFKRLAATYGARWDASLGQTPLNDVKTVWAHELSSFSGSLHRVAWALENLPERCPNPIEFKNLCRQAPSPDNLAIEAPLPKQNPEMAAKVKEALAKPAQQVDFKAWARVILRDHAGGIKINPTKLQMARDALRESA